MVNYIGKAALTLVRVGGSMAYVYAGEPVPEGATDAEYARLLEDGFIAPLDAAVDIVAARVVPESQPAVVIVPETVSESGEPSGPPAKSAPKADWEAYARSQGATDADLEGQTKDDLIAAYGD
jgi:hypothetical protein